MIVLQSDKPLAWGALDLPLAGVARDWFGKTFEPPPFYALAVDPERLWFVAGHRSPAALHPAARPGVFQAELWRHDVAELFLADPASGRYLEVNLAPNGAWWNCEMTAPRVRASEHDEALPGVETHAELAPDGSWLAAIAMPLVELRERVGFSPETTLNVTFILGSPTQRFLSATDLGPGQPDYHRPVLFRKPAWLPLSAAGQVPP